MYDRPEHLWTGRSVDRINQRWIRQQDPAEPMMMSEIADRMILGIASRLGLFLIPELVAKLISRLSEVLRFGAAAPPEDLPKGARFLLPLRLEAAPPEGPSPAGEIIRQACNDILQYLDSIEGGPNGETP